MVCVGDYGLLPCGNNRQRHRGREAECIETEVSKEALGGMNDEHKEIKQVCQFIKEVS